MRPGAHTCSYRAAAHSRGADGSPTAYDGPCDDCAYSGSYVGSDRRAAYYGTYGSTYCCSNRDSGRSQANRQNLYLLGTEPIHE